ncbi:MAG TPA: glycosyltransferase family 4 protein [Candidatus Dojkabacteria bacterium]|nr:glycosyltransferase family 4 protein [Candidatus Dojkabacteria bacterium]HRP50933.1 glycosyltransferase family 4 protein [Candidatus Dojkabacteria bacterium]
MKLIISTYDDIKNPNYGGGGAIALHELAKRLTRKFEVTVISWNHSGIKNENIDGVEYARIGFSFISPKIAMFIFQMILPFFAIFKSFDLWIESFAPPFTTAFLPIFTRKPVVGVVHMLAAEDMKRKYKVDLGRIENAGIRKYKHIVSTQNMIREKILSVNPQCNCKVISNGIEKVYPEKVTKKKQFLFLGRIEINQKGLDLLIDTFKKFNKLSKEKYKLVIAGSGLDSDLKRLKQLIKESELDNQIVLAGRVEGKSKETLMKESTAMILTSRFETFSMVALESLAFGLPLVTFDIEGLKWIPDNVVRKAESFNTDDLANVLLEIINNKKLQEEMRINGLKYATKYTWDNIAKEYEDLIDEIKNAKR